MPIYEYKIDEKASGCEFCADGFEQLQSLSDEPLSKCPECGAKCHRIFSSFSTGKSAKDILSKKNLEKGGFTQYKKAGGGFYEKTAGKGPDVIS